MSELIQLRVRAPEESFKLELRCDSTLGDLLSALSQKLVKSQRQLELSSNNVAIPTNDRSASLAALGLGKGGAIKVGLKGDALLDTKSMFEGLLPTQGESKQYQDAEQEYMRALGRSLEHNPLGGLGLTSQAPVEEKKPERGLITAPISTQVSLSDKNPSLAQAGYVPAEQPLPEGGRRWSRSRSRGKKHHHKSHRKRERSSSRKRRKHSRSRERRKHKKRSKSRSSSRDNKNKKKKKSRSRSSSRDKEHTKPAPAMDYLSLKAAGAEVPKRLLEQQENKALAIRAKLTKAKQPPAADNANDNDNDNHNNNDNSNSEQASLRAAVLAERRRDLNAVAAADEDFSVENRVRNVLKKKLSDKALPEEGASGLQSVRANMDRSQNKQSLLAAFEDDTQKDLSSVHDLLLPRKQNNNKNNNNKNNNHSNNGKPDWLPRDVDQDHYDAIFSTKLDTSEEQQQQPEPSPEPDKPKLSWRDRARAAALARQTQGT